MADSLSDQNIIQLLERYGEGALSPDEEAAFFQWYQQAGWEEFSRLWAQCKTFPKGGITRSPEMPILFKEQLERAINNFENGDAQSLYLFKKPWIRSYSAARKTGPVRRRIGLRMAGMAAAVMVILAGGGYWWLHRQSPAPAVAATKAIDIAAPMTSRATIILAGGQKVFLDSVRSGTVAVQGNVTVIKRADGQVVYSGSAPQAPGSTIGNNTLSNPRGSKPVSLTLSDGTNVWLNSESSLTYPAAFVGKERKVTITGEAYFEVTKNAAMPFTVTKGETTITVLGTDLNVNAYADETNLKVTLLEGSVKVTRGNASDLLRPGQQAQIGKGIQVISDVDVDEVMAWKNGKFIFGEKANIETIMNQIARWYDIDVEYQKKVNVHFGGSISRQVNASKLLEKLEMTGDVHFKIEGKKVIVMP
jgi:transmembrane sensor